MNETSYLSLNNLLYCHFRSKKLSKADDINIKYNREAVVDCDGYVEFHGRGWWLINVFANPTDQLSKINAKAFVQIGFYFSLLQKKCFRVREIITILYLRGIFFFQWR